MERASRRASSVKYPLVTTAGELHNWAIETVLRGKFQEYKGGTLSAIGNLGTALARGLRMISSASVFASVLLANV
jgi:hypothetical protein